MGNNNTKRHNKDTNQPLSDDELLNLSIHNGYSFESVKKYYESFMNDCPSGKLSRHQFRDIYRQLYPNSKSTKFCDRIFKTFDYSGRNYLDFQEFLTAITVTINGTKTQKLTCAFKIYDLNSDGKLDKRELKKIMGHIQELLGEDRIHSRQASKSADKQVDLIFKKFNLKNNETLTLEQFISGCLRDDYLGAMFTNNDGAILRSCNSSQEIVSKTELCSQ